MLTQTTTYYNQGMQKDLKAQHKPHGRWATRLHQLPPGQQDSLNRLTKMKQMRIGKDTGWSAAIFEW